MTSISRENTYLNSNMELLIWSKFSFSEVGISSFKFQYGATNIFSVSIEYSLLTKFKFQYGATNMKAGLVALITIF